MMNKNAIDLRLIFLNKGINQLLYALKYANKIPIPKFAVTLKVWKYNFKSSSLWAYLYQRESAINKDAVIGMQYWKYLAFIFEAVFKMIPQKI